MQNQQKQDTIILYKIEKNNFRINILFKDTNILIAQNYLLLHVRLRQKYLKDIIKIGQSSCTHCSIIELVFYLMKKTKYSMNNALLAR